MDEFELIKCLNASLNSNFTEGEIGPGDDAALIKSISIDQLLVSKDLLVENVHFDLSYSTPQDLGWKALAVNESDICAMGGEVRGYLIGLAIPKDKQNFSLEIYKGMREYLTYSNSFGGNTPIYGGDTVHSPTIVISVTVIGESKNPIKRSGAKIGDDVWLSGSLGASESGLRLLQGDKRFSGLNIKDFELSHRRPRPQKKLSRYLSSLNSVTSMIDISDGLFQDLGHLADMSGVSFLINFDEVPTCVDKPEERDKIELVCGGEDYQLLFTIPPMDGDLIKKDFHECVKIGTVTKQDVNKVLIKMDDSVLYTINQILKRNNLEKIGFKHF